MGASTHKHTGFTNITHGKAIYGIHDTSGDMISWPSDLESINAELSETGLRQVRIEASIKTGMPFEALKKKYRSSPKEKQGLNYGSDEGASPGGIGASSELEAHPLMPYTGGIIDTEFNPTADNESLLLDALPEGPAKWQLQKKKKEKDRKELSNRLKAKQSFKFNVAPAPDRKYRYVAPPPRQAPPKPRPPGL